MNVACCACLKVIYSPTEKDGLNTDRWACSNCGGEFERKNPNRLSEDLDEITRKIESFNRDYPEQHISMDYYTVAPENAEGWEPRFTYFEEFNKPLL